MASYARKALNLPIGKISLTFIEAMLVGILRNLDTLGQRTDVDLTKTFETMLEAPQFAEAARYAIASEKNVKARLSTATAVFAGI